MKKQFEIKSLMRVIAHRIVRKTKSTACYPETRDSLYTLNARDNAVLIERIEKAVNNRKKCFELSFQNKGDYSMFKHLSNLGFVAKDDSFIDFSKETAEKLSESQDNISIPGGYCLVTDGRLNGGEYFICIIKADYQEVFNVHENSMHVLNDVFLSPAKDFYKVGFFVQDKEKMSFKPYMYDDQFSIYKDDLTLYFYDRFLGLSTDESNKLKTKNLYMDIIKFIDENVDYSGDHRGLIKAAQSYFRENTEGRVSAEEFCERFLHNTILETPFKKQYCEKYPRAIVLDTTLLSNERLMTQRTTLGGKITIITRDGVKMTLLSEENMDKIVPTIKSGKNTKVVIFETTEEE